MPSYSSSSSSASSNQLEGSIKLHPYLCKTQAVIAHNFRSYILWDIREHPRTAKLVRQLPLPLSPELLNAYATDPPVPSLTVTCGYPKSWSITVYAPGVTPPSSAISYHSTYTRPSRVVGITIANLLTAIYDHLRSQPVSATDLIHLQPKQHARLFEAYEKRKKTIQGTDQQSWSAPSSLSAVDFRQTITPPSIASYAGSAPSTREAAQEGVKLVDTFLLHTLFAGLEVDHENEYTVNLSVKRPT